MDSIAGLQTKISGLNSLHPLMNSEEKAVPSTHSKDLPVKAESRVVTNLWKAFLSFLEHHCK